MSLTARLKQAEQKRRKSAGLPDLPGDREPDEPVVDLSQTGASVIDLTGARTAAEATAETLSAPGPRLTSVPDRSIAFDPVRDGDATSAFRDRDPVTDGRTRYPCPRCGSATQIDLIDQVHQTVSLSCLSCFHMFRVNQ